LPEGVLTASASEPNLRDSQTLATELRAAAQATGAPPITAYVVALAIQETIVTPYEDACRAAGLLPVSIGCAALWLYTLYRPVLRQMPTWFFVHLASDAMTFLAVRGGVPVYCRMKSRRASVTAMQDIASTIQFYEDLYPQDATEEPREPIPLYLTGAGVPQALTATEAGGSASPGSLFASRPVAPIVLDWTSRLASDGATPETEEALCALACAVGA
jgi:hypothetical protein